MKLTKDDPIERGAELSDDGVYRYLLWRRWNEALPWATFIMLNPSTADASMDDPTIRRCIGFARLWGMGGIRVVNLYPFRATNPSDLWKAPFPRGHGNINYIRQAVSSINVAAWGAHGREAQVAEVRSLFADLELPLYALHINDDGSPKHPLYVAATAVPVCFDPAGTKISKGSAWVEARLALSTEGR